MSGIPGCFRIALELRAEEVTGLAFGDYAGEAVITPPGPGGMILRGMTGTVFLQLPGFLYLRGRGGEPGSKSPLDTGNGAAAPPEHQ